MSSSSAGGFGRRAGSTGGSGTQLPNDKSKKIIIAASVVFVASIVALIVILFKKQKVEETSVVLQEERKESRNIVFVLERPVYAGQRMADAVIREVPWSASDIPEDAVKNRQEFTGKYALTDITTNVPIRQSFISEKVAEAKLKVSPGNRAVTIQVDATSGLEGLAQPGMRVDVALTHSSEEGLRSLILVANARILSVDGSTQDFTKKQVLDPRIATNVVSGTSSVKTVTLDVSPADALKITTGAQMGKLSLFARPIDSLSSEGSGERVITQNQIDPKPAQAKPTSAAGQAKKCVKGVIKSGDKQFEVQCDGSMIELGQYE